MKKLVSLCLVLALVLAMGVIPAMGEEYVKLTWATGPSVAPIDNAMAIEAMNEITREALGVEVEIYYFDSAVLQNSIQAGEVYDMYYTCSWYNNYNVAVSNGWFANIWPHLQEWTPDLYAVLEPEIWEMAKSTDGGLYGIPVRKDYAPQNFIVYDGAFAREAGFEIPARIDSWDELTDYLVALQASMPEGEYAVTIGGQAAGLETSFDFIDRTPMIGVLFGETEVKTQFEDPAVMDRYRTLHKWYEMGLVNPDAATLTENAVDNKHNHIKFVQAWTGYDYTPSWGYECAMTCYSGPFLSTDGVQGSMNAFSVTLEDDLERFELAMKYQELVNTNQLLRDMLRYGVQGYHWNYVDVKDAEGNVKGQAVIKTDVGNSNYSVWAFAQGSYQLASIATSEECLNGTFPPPDLEQWDKYFEDCKTAPVSAISGFTFNSSDFQNQYAEISAIKDQYYKGIASGTTDPDVMVPEMLEKLYAAGLQDIIDAAQEQLDAYLASK